MTDIWKTGAAVSINEKKRSGGTDKSWGWKLILELLCHDMVISGTGIKTLLLNLFKAFASNECDAFSVDMALIFTEPQPCQAFE